MPPTDAGRLHALDRHPLKGFTPQALPAVELEAGAPFPGDRLWAVEHGPSGFDPARPAHLPKRRYLVLAGVAEVARIRTAVDPDTGAVEAEAPGVAPFHGSLRADGRERFAAWLADALLHLAPDARRAPLRVLDAPGWRFTDDPAGDVSLVNLATVRDLGERLGRTLDPRRLRANLYVDGWPAGREHDLPPGARVAVGGAVLERIAPIRRCAAVDVDPDRGVRDLEATAALHAAYGHMDCGIYFRVVRGGRAATGDPVRIAPADPAEEPRA